MKAKKGKKRAKNKRFSKYKNFAGPGEIKSTVRYYFRREVFTIVPVPYDICSTVPVRKVGTVDFVDMKCSIVTISIVPYVKSVP